MTEIRAAERTITAIGAMITLLVAFIALAGGFVLGMNVDRGELKKPAAGASYELVIVGKSGRGAGTRYYTFGKYYPDIEVLERDLAEKRAVFKNGVFRIEESGKDKK